jgi:hypothetical protein
MQARSPCVSACGKSEVAQRADAVQSSEPGRDRLLRRLILAIAARKIEALVLGLFRPTGRGAELRHLGVLDAHQARAGRDTFAVLAFVLQALSQALFLISLRLRGRHVGG